ncbi:MAG: M23 family metallopeptidase [Magnetococcus sp. YQC-9]
MLSLYPTPAFIRNRSLQVWSKNGAEFVGYLWQAIYPRLFTLVIPALVATIAASYLLGNPTLNGSSGSLGHETSRTREQALSATRNTLRTLAVLPNDPAYTPNLAALDGLFGADLTDDTQEPEPDALTVNSADGKEASEMEAHINQTLLETLDPFLLTREQLTLFAASIPTGYPVPFQGINSPFGFRMHPTHQETRFHPAVDLRASMNTPITATADGVVEFAGVDNGRLGLNGLGQVISLHHNFGFRTTYSHLNKIHVKAGDFVRKGDLIGLTGQSGIVTAPHLHYEVRFIHQYLNPAPFLTWTPDQHERLFKEKNVQWVGLLDQLSTRPTHVSRQLARAEPPPPKPTMSQPLIEAIAASSIGTSPDAMIETIPVTASDANQATLITEHHLSSGQTPK